MTYDELNRDQRAQLKARLIDDRNGGGVSWWEIANADALISDDDAREVFGGVEFVEEDFF